MGCHSQPLFLQFPGMAHCWCARLGDHVTIYSPPIASSPCVIRPGLAGLLRGENFSTCYSPNDRTIPRQHSFLPLVFITAFLHFSFSTTPFPSLAGRLRCSQAPTFNLSVMPVSLFPFSTFSPFTRVIKHPSLFLLLIIRDILIIWGRYSCGMRLH